MTDTAPGAGAVLWFEDGACRETRLAGGKGASLATMTAQGLPVPPGFVIPAQALESAVDAERLRALAQAGDHEAAHALVLEARPPREEIVSAYRRLCADGGDVAVAVRSSATAEDSEAASYAGQQETYLHVQGDEDVCRRVVDCWASFFTERALFYRGRKGELSDLGMAVVVQKMLEPDTAGVLFTVDAVNRRRDRVVIEAVRGLGEQVVSGHVTPDHYVLDRKGNVKRQHLQHGGVLSEDELRRLVELGLTLEQHFGTPQDIEWAIADGRIYLLQSRPVTTV